jgi:hypothetical protein
MDKIAEQLASYPRITIQKLSPNYIRLSYKKLSYLILKKDYLISIRLVLPLLWRINLPALPILVFSLKVAFEAYYSKFWNIIASIFVVVFSVGWIIYGTTFLIKFKTKDFLNIFDKEFNQNHQ